jgi:CHU_C Type IX secretion signal domain
MRRLIQHIVLLLMLTAGFTKVIAQNAMPDTVCAGATRVYKVEGSSPLSTYTWMIEGVVQAGSSSEMNMTWNTAGVFLVTVQEHSPDGCDGDLRSGIVYVDSNARSNAGPDIVVCFGTPARLNGSGGASYQWSPATYLTNENIADPVANIPVAGVYDYILQVNNNNSCPMPAGDTVLVTILPQAMVFAGNDTSAAPGIPIQLHAADVNGTGFTGYSWSPAVGLNDWLAQNPFAVINNDITYTVTASSPEGCMATDAITVKISRIAEIYVPTAFSPNGVNSLLHAVPVGIREFRYFAIYNRYGQLVFKTSNPAEGWDGRFKGIPQSSAGFVWIAEGVGYNGKLVSKKGNVVLLR